MKPYIVSRYKENIHKCLEAYWFLAPQGGIEEAVQPGDVQAPTAFIQVGPVGEFNRPTKRTSIIRTYI